MNRSSCILLSAIVLAGLILRALYLVQLTGSDIGDVLPLDMVFYRDLAAGLVSAGRIPPGAISFNPLYPFFLAGLFRLFGEGLVAVRIIQMLLGGATVLLSFSAGRRLASLAGEKAGRAEAAGLVSALLAAFYTQFPMYEGSLLATTLVTLIFTASFYIALSFEMRQREQAGDDDPEEREGKGGRSRMRAPAWLMSLVLGMLVGAGSLGRPNLFLLLAPALPVLVFIRSGKGKRGLRHGSICLAGTILLLLPPVIFNASRTGEFVPVATHGGINFYIGNRSGANGIYQPPEGMRSDMRGLIEDSRMTAERETGRRMSDAEASGFWMSQARNSILSDPAGFIRLMGRKFILFWNGKEVSDIVDSSVFAGECPALRAFFVPFTLISALALPGLLLVFLLRRNRLVTMIFAGAAMASIMLFYINARYRVPSVAVLSAYAGLFVVWTAGRAVEKHWRRFAAALCAFLVVLLLISSRKMVEVDKSAAYTFLGNHFMQNGETEKGEEAFEKAYNLAPRLVMTNINYGRVLIGRGRLEESRRLYAYAYEKEPAFPMLAVEYGSLLDQLGQRDTAVGMYKYALGLGRSRDRLVACQLLSRIAYDEGRLGEAAQWVREALAISPEDQRLKDLLRLLEKGEE